MFEGHRRVEYQVNDEGKVERVAFGYFGNAYVKSAAKVVANSVEEFRARYPNQRIANLVERSVVKVAPMDLRARVAALSDEELAQMGLVRSGAGTPLPADFPGYLPLRRAGIATLEQVANMTHSELVELNGIGDKLADRIIAHVHGGNSGEPEKDKATE